MRATVNSGTGGSKRVMKLSNGCGLLGKMLSLAGRQR